MPRCELVRMRAEDIDEGRRVRLPKAKHLSIVTGVESVDWVRCAVSTEDGVHVCKRSALLDVEDDGEVCP